MLGRVDIEIQLVNKMYQQQPTLCTKTVLKISYIIPSHTCNRIKVIKNIFNSKEVNQSQK